MARLLQNALSMKRFLLPPQVIIFSFAYSKRLDFEAAVEFCEFNFFLFCRDIEEDYWGLVLSFAIFLLKVVALSFLTLFCSYGLCLQQLNVVNVRFSTFYFK